VANRAKPGNLGDRNEMRDAPIDNGALRVARNPREQVFAAE
jgi:hypothetical protein